MDEKLLKEGEAVYKTVTDALDERGLNYETDKEHLSLNFTIGSDDLTIELLVIVIPDMQIISFLSPLPFSCAEENRSKMAVAINALNMKLPAGFFLFPDIGSIKYCIAQHYYASIISKETIQEIIEGCFFIVDNYNEKIFFYEKDKIDLEELLA
jgi:hypothetical protein